VGPDNISTSSIEVTKLFGSLLSKETTVRALVVAVVTPIPKTACLTRCPSSRTGSTSFVTGSGTGISGDTLLGVRGRYSVCLRGPDSAVAGEKSVRGRRFATTV
jgi:hypothetical protein